jgi:hypothetical protein
MLNKKSKFLVIFILSSSVILAQPGPPGSPCWPPPCIPVDGGISLFTLASILFGYRFLSKNK